MQVIERDIGRINPPVTPQVGLWVKGIYGVGQIANSVKTIVFGIFSLFFYTTVMGLPGTLVGVASAIGLLWDAIIDPVIGTLSDKAEGRLGKRHGFMLVGAAGMGVSFWAYFSPPQALSSQVLFVWLLATNLLVRTMSSVFSIPYYALGAELSQDYHQRTSISGIRGGFALFGTLATAVLSFVLFFPALPQGGDLKLNVEGYRAMGLFCGLVMSVVAAVSSFGTLSHRQFVCHKPGKPLPNGRRHFFSNTLLALRNRSFRMLFLSYSIFFLGTVINATLAIHFLTYYVRITTSKSLSAFHLAFYVGALLGVVFWLRISRMVEKHWLYFTGTLSTATVMCCAFIFLGEGHLFGVGSLSPVLVGSWLAGFFASVLWIIPPSMIADIADQDELLNGERREGVFFGLFNFGEQIAAGASILITGILIDHFAGLIPGQALQSATTINRIGVLYGLLPCFLLVAAALFILRYSLNQGAVAAIQSKLHWVSQEKVSKNTAYHKTEIKQPVDWS
jgi:GPH family glycoside/pentoside/hexuronide:cation symporter